MNDGENLMPVFKCADYNFPRPFVVVEDRKKKKRVYTKFVRPCFLLFGHGGWRLNFRRVSASLSVL